MTLPIILGFEDFGTEGTLIGLVERYEWFFLDAPKSDCPLFARSAT
jgi:hypothetical protein